MKPQRFAGPLIFLVIGAIVLFLFFAGQDELVFPSTDLSEANNASVAPRTLSPDELFANLTPVDSLEASAVQFSDTLGIGVGDIRVRLRFSGCSACEMKENAALSDLSLDEAKEQLAESDAFWLVKDDLLCFYMSLKGEWVPKSCAIFLAPGRESG